MVSQVTEYLNITGSNQFYLAIEDIEDGIMLPCVPLLVQGNVGIKIPHETSHTCGLLLSLCQGGSMCGKLHSEFNPNIWQALV